jgi:TatD DNase family protein
LYQSYFKTLGITDVHTHHKDAGVNAIYNILPQDFETIQLKVNQYYSAGLHPWYITNAEQQLQQLEQLIGRHKNIILLGECGLDKLKGPDFELQKKVFIDQILLAQKYNLPLIIHCVKAYQDILIILKQTAFKGLFIFHGFNKNVKLAQQIIDAGGAISLGLKVQVDKTILESYLKFLPKEQVLLESD